MGQSHLEPATSGARRAWRGSVAIAALPLAILLVVVACRLDVAALVAAGESTAALLRSVDAVGPAGASPATAELVARLCDGRLVGEEARGVVAALWPPRVTPDATSYVGEPLSLNARLDGPTLDVCRDDGPTLAWRLIDVRVDGGEAIAPDAPHTLTRLGASGQSPRCDTLAPPDRVAPGLVRLECRYEYELRDAAGGTTRWVETFARTVLLFAREPDR